MSKIVGLRGIAQEDTIIALMGPTGTGKSTFINTATLQKGKTIGHGLDSYTSEIRTVRFNHPKSGKPYVLVDTPGFNDTNKSDTEILSLIADWLKETYKNNVKLGGIVYLHRISDNRMAGSPLKNLTMFARLCGDTAASHVVLATTMWSRVKRDIGENRQAELRNKYWHGLIELGSDALRFGDSFNSAWDIIDRAVGKDISKEENTDITLLLQEELVDLNRRLNETAAGQTLYTSLQKLLAEQKETVRRLRDQAKTEENEQLSQELTKQYQEIEELLESTFEQIAKMKIPLGRRIRMLFSFRRARAHTISIHE